MQPKINVLIIDDDPTIIFLTKKVISLTGHSTIINECHDGQEAIEFIENEKSNVEQLPDLIFLDLSMPVADGWDFLNEYVQIEPQIQKKITLYIVSSSISPHDVERSKTYKVVKDFIIKPLNKEKLNEIFQSALTMLSVKMQTSQ